MPELVHTWEENGESVTFHWLGDVDVPPDRVYAFAFTSDREMLLVSDPKWEPAGWLPGGGVQGGESPLQALHRELIEEANAKVLKLSPWELNAPSTPRKECLIMPTTGAAS